MSSGSRWRVWSSLTGFLRSAFIRLPPVVPLVLLSVSVILDLLSFIAALSLSNKVASEDWRQNVSRVPGLLRLAGYSSLISIALLRLRAWWEDVRVEVNGVIIKPGRLGLTSSARDTRGRGDQLNEKELTADDYELCRQRYKYTPWPPPEVLGWAPFGTVPFGPQEAPKACYWTQGDATCFKVRQKGYAKTGLKLPSKYPIYECIGVDVVRSDMVLRKAAQLSVFQKVTQGEDSEGSEMPSFWTRDHGLSELHWDKEIGIPRFLLVNCQLPFAAPPLFGSPDPNDAGMSILTYFVINPKVLQEYRDGNLEKITAIKLFQRLLHTGVSKKGHSALKIIAMVENAGDLGLPGIINRYNGKPALLTKSLQLHSNVDGEGEVAEIDFDIRQWCYLARKSFHSFYGLLKDCVAHVGLVMEGEDDSELPEQLLACFRIAYLDIEQAKLIDAAS
ncbi:putative ATP-dependent RNA helicase ddx43 [Perkinsus chesapeaki]|uniref:Putative ATP-dependent RNA helicase ddx43 n=1 Tax=Perkinsus chesapeaki TaxID=330153 RepID=A0A7J6M109_PERCH|nr:putative ATP-dependent RNA helicase ddx43 [Perkinsus chesapeaki]